MVGHIFVRVRNASRSGKMNGEQIWGISSLDQQTYCGKMARTVHGWIEYETAAHIVMITRWNGKPPFESLLYI